RTLFRGDLTGFSPIVHVLATDSGPGGESGTWDMRFFTVPGAATAFPARTSASAGRSASAPAPSVPDASARNWPSSARHDPSCFAAAGACAAGPSNVLARARGKE